MSMHLDIDQLDKVYQIGEKHNCHRAMNLNYLAFGMCLSL